jgi:hypothetical protein
MVKIVIMRKLNVATHVPSEAHFVHEGRRESARITILLKYEKIGMAQLM